MRESEKQIRFFASQCLTAQETERKRIAAELHDSIASSLAAIKFNIEKTQVVMEQGLATPNPCKVWSPRSNRPLWKPEGSWPIYGPLSWMT